jgi:hypothetical protein
VNKERMGTRNGTNIIWSCSVSKERMQTRNSTNVKWSSGVVCVKREWEGEMGKMLGG